VSLSVNRPASLLGSTLLLVAIEGRIVGRRTIGVGVWFGEVGVAAPGPVVLVTVFGGVKSGIMMSISSYSTGIADIGTERFGSSRSVDQA
jgi:hypothetical protein